MKHHKIFFLSKPLWAALLLSNLLFACWVEKRVGSYWGWTVVDLSNNLVINSATVFPVLQFALFGLTVDMLMRLLVGSINSKTKQFKVPAITVMAMSISIYAIVGLLGFILLYDHSLSHILAAAGALGLGAAYAFRDFIADVTASIQIQTDHLASINDYIEVSGEKDVYKVIQIDHRMITIEDKFSYLIQVPTRQFLNWKYINISKQPSRRGVKRRCTFSITTQNESGRVLEAMDIAMKHLISKDDRFYRSYACQIQLLEGGMIGYGISYECDPSLSHFASTSLVYGPLLHILNTATINLNADIEVNHPKAALSEAQQRLIDIYRFSILKALSEKQIEELSKVIKIIYFEAGDQIIAQGELAQSMYLISEGHLEVSILNKDGSALIVANLWPGDCVGEMSLLTGEPRSANVCAKSKCILLELTKDDLAPIFQSSPVLIEKISQILSDRKLKNEKALMGDVQKELVVSQVKILAQRIFKFFFG